MTAVKTGDSTAVGGSAGVPTSGGVALPDAWLTERATSFSSTVNHGWWRELMGGGNPARGEDSSRGGLGRHEGSERTTLTRPWSELPRQPTTWLCLYRRRASLSQLLLSLSPTRPTAGVRERRKRPPVGWRHHGPREERWDGQSSDRHGQRMGSWRRGGCRRFGRRIFCISALKWWNIEV